MASESKLEAVSCPACGRPVVASLINQHLDRCCISDKFSKDGYEKVCSPFSSHGRFVEEDSEDAVDTNGSLLKKNGESAGKFSAKTHSFFQPRRISSKPSHEYEATAQVSSEGCKSQRIVHELKSNHRLLCEQSRGRSSADAYLKCTSEQVSFQTKNKNKARSLLPSSGQGKRRQTISVSDSAESSSAILNLGALKSQQSGSTLEFQPLSETTLAHIISRESKKHGARFVTLSAVSAGVKEVKDLISKAQADQTLSRARTLLFLDEIHRFNKAQQDVFLPHIEKGIITLIGATTENPSFSLNSALISRCT